MKKRTVALLMAAVLLFGAAVGGTFAWLTAYTDPLVNTFTAGHVNITLSESNAVGNTKSFKMVPGATIEKDPTIAVLADSEECYVYVKIQETADLDTYISYTPAAGWTKMAESDDHLTTVYYRLVNAVTAAAGTEFSVLTGNTVTVNNVSADDMALVGEGDVQLIFTGYAVQKTADGGTTPEAAAAQAAWTAAGFGEI